MFTPPRFGIRRAGILALAGLIAAIGLEARAIAAEGLQQELHALAGKIKELMDKERIDAIAVGEFTGQAGLYTNAGPQIKDVLTKELTSLKVTVKSPAHYEIKGDYRPFDDPDTRLTCVKITAMVFDDNGIVSNFKLSARLVHGNTDLYEMSGATTDLNPTGDQPNRNQQIKQAIYNPSCHVEGSKVCTKAGSPYVVEVLAKRGGAYVPVPARNVKGVPFVSLGKNDVYALRLYNNTPHEAAAQVLVDGLGMFRFSEIKAKNGDPFKFVVIPPYGQVEVKGWFVNLKRTDEFRIVPLGTSSIAKFKNSSNVGVITVSFAAAWEKGNPSKRPADEPQARSVETDRGNTISVDYKEVERDYGAVRSTISIRYDK